MTVLVHLVFTGVEYLKMRILKLGILDLDYWVWYVTSLSSSSSSSFSLAPSSLTHLRLLSSLIHPQSPLVLFEILSLEMMCADNQANSGPGTNGSQVSPLSSYINFTLLSLSPLLDVIPPLSSSLSKLVYSKRRRTVYCHHLLAEPMLTDSSSLHAPQLNSSMVNTVCLEG
jgi:hypothetical protein